MSNTTVVQRHGSVIVATPQGPLRCDTVEALQSQVKSSLRGGVPRVVIDLAQTPLIDSAGLEWILSLDETCCRQGGCVRLCGVGELCDDVLRITGLGQRLQRYVDVTAALGSFA